MSTNDDVIANIRMKFAQDEQSIKKPINVKSINTMGFDGISTHPTGYANTSIAGV
jgi:hypothetical protein